MEDHKNKQSLAVLQLLDPKGFAERKDRMQILVHSFNDKPAASDVDPLRPMQRAIMDRMIIRKNASVGPSEMPMEIVGFLLADRSDTAIARVLEIDDDLLHAVASLED